MRTARAGRAGLWGPALIAGPVAVGVAYAAAAATGLAGFGPRSFSLSRIGRVLGEAAVWDGFLWSVRTAAVATALASAASVLVAITFRRAGWSDRAARSLAVLPLPLPHLAAAAGALLVLGQTGLLARLAHAVGWIGGPADMPPLLYDRRGVGVVLALAWKEFPFLALLSFSLLATRGTALEETARSLGAVPSEVFRRVTWPLLWRGLAPGVVAVYAFAVGSYETAALLGPSDPLPLPVLTLERFTDSDLSRRGDAFVLVLLGLALAGAIVTVHELLRARAESDE